MEEERQEKTGCSLASFRSAGEDQERALGCMVSRRGLDAQPPLRRHRVDIGWGRHGDAQFGEGSAESAMNIDLEKLRKFMEDIASKRGPFTLFALLLRDDALVDEWDLVVSAPWLKVGDLKALKVFAKGLSAAIGEEGVLSLSHIARLKADEPAVDTILALGGSGDSGETVEVRDFDVAGLNIRRGYILHAERPQPEPSTVA